MKEAHRVGAHQKAASLVDVVRGHVSRRPERVACNFMDSSLEPVASLRYGDLDLRARAIASRLADRRGERALMLYPSGPEFVSALLGCLYAGVVSVPVDVPRPGRESIRLDSVVAGAQPSLVLTTARIADPAGHFLASHSLRERSCWIATDITDLSEAEAWRDPGLTDQDIALLQYTSGSTSSPKGAVISHGNLIANSDRVGRQFGHSEFSHLATWLPHYHDMGLIGTLLHPLLFGFPTTILPSLAFVQRPVRWLQMISLARATTSGAPNFAYDLCVERVTKEAKANLDLSCWEVAFNGAEPIRKLTIERFSAAFTECGFRKEAFFPCYGMAEATLFVSGGPKHIAPRYRDNPVFNNQADLTEGSSQVLVSSGLCAEPSEVAIVDPETLETQPAGCVGEIWLRGPCVARGYWEANAVDMTRFNHWLPNDGSGPFFRTGDLGLLADGELYLTGRLSDVLIIAGAKHHPADIEDTIDHCHPWVATGRSLAFGIEERGEERLVVGLELSRHDWAVVANRDSEARSRSKQTRFDPERLIGDVRAAVLRRHGVRAYAVELLPPGGLPRTTSGKLRRRAGRAAWLAGAWSRDAEPGPAPRTGYGKPQPIDEGLTR